MSKLGTAPRRVAPGKWRTRTGRDLTEDGSAYWEHQFQIGHTDGKGHMTAPKPSSVFAATKKIADESPKTGISLTDAVKLAAKVAYEGTPVAAVEHAVRKPSPRRVGAALPVIGPSFEAGLDTAEAGRSAGRRIAQGKLPTPMEAVTLASLFPGFRGGKAARAALEAESAAKAVYPTGTLLHGSPEGAITLNSLDPLYHTKLWREGQGFYMTPDEPKALKYAAGKTASLARRDTASGRLSGFKLKKEANVLDVDALPESYWRGLASEIIGEPVPEKLWKEWAQDIPFGKASVGVTNRMRLMHFLTGWGELPHQDSFYVIEEALANRGVQVTLHRESGIPVYVVKDKTALEEVLPSRVEGIPSGIRPPAARPSAAAWKIKLPPEPLPSEVIPNAAAEAGRKAVLDVLPDAEVLYAQQEALRRVERARRAAQLGPAFEQAGGGEAGYKAAGKVLEGGLPALNFDDLAGQLDPPVMSALLDAVHAHTLLQPFEKRSLQTALKRLQGGQPIRPFEQKLIRKAFGDGTIIGEPATKRGALEYVSDIINIPRSLMATGEFSYRLRNGLFALGMKPVGGIRTAKGALGVTFSQPKFDALQNALHSDPELMEAMQGISGPNGKVQRLALTDTGHHLPHREEAFPSPLAEKITGGRLSPVRAAGRNFTANALLDRAMIYKSLLDQARREGIEVDDHLKASAIRVANWATGRSDWGHEKIEMLTNTFLFAPKLFKTRLEVLNVLPGKHGFYSQLHPMVRKEVVKGLGRLVAVGVGILAIAAKYAGADVELDPRSSDFGKMRFGNTRFDIWGGNQQIARTVAQELTQTRKSSTTGEFNKLGKGEHFDPLSNLFEGKLSPPFSFALDLKRGEMFAGRPLTAEAEAKEHLIPLLYQDIYDAQHHGGAGMGALTGLLGWYGVGAQTYASQKEKAGGSGPVWGRSRRGGGFKRENTEQVWGGGRR